MLFRSIMTQKLRPKKAFSTFVTRGPEALADDEGILLFCIQRGCGASKIYDFASPRVKNDPAFVVACIAKDVRICTRLSYEFTIVEMDLKCDFYTYMVSRQVKRILVFDRLVRMFEVDLSEDEDFVEALPKLEMLYEEMGKYKKYLSCKKTIDQLELGRIFNIPAVADKLLRRLM